MNARLGLRRESGGAVWPMFLQFQTGAAKPVANVFVTHETRGA